LRIKYHYQCKLEIEDIKTVKGEDNDGNAVDIVVSRSTELKLIDEKTEFFKYT
jgi:DNA-directed RNA polymerase subunit beta'